MKSILLFLCTFSIIGSANENHFSVTELASLRLAKCFKVPGRDSMREQLDKAYYTEPLIRKKYVLNGFKVSLSEAELKDFFNLTRHIDHDAWYFTEYFPTDTYTKDGVTYINQECKELHCTLKHVDPQFYDLKSKSPKSTCTGIYCAVNTLFGKQGLEILYSEKVLNLNLSPMQNPSADRMSSENHKFIIKAFNSLPDHMKDFERQYRFYHYKKGYRPASASDYTLANASGQIFDLFDTESDGSKFSTILHELGHMYASREFYDTEELGPLPNTHFAQTDSWLAITKWEPNIEETEWGEQVYYTRPNDYNLKKEKQVSGYSNTNPSEDFAESFIMYRISPNIMKSKFPKRYSYMRDLVFRGIEYTEDLCNGSRPSNQNPGPSNTRKANQ